MRAYSTAPIAIGSAQPASAHSHTSAFAYGPASSGGSKRRLALRMRKSSWFCAALICRSLGVDRVTTRLPLLARLRHGEDAGWARFPVRRRLGAHPSDPLALRDRVCELLG